MRSSRYNQERPHAAPDRHVPASLYTASRQAYRGLDELTYPRRNHRGDALRSDLLQRTEGQPESQTFAGQNRRRDAGRRPSLASELYELRLGVFRRPDRPSGTDRESDRPKKCYLYARNELSPM